MEKNENIVTNANKSGHEKRNVPTLRFRGFTDNWALTPIKKLLKFQNGINADSNKYGKGVKYISVSDILNNQYITYDCIKGLIDIDEKTFNKFIVEYGDILFQRSSETFEDIGRANVYLDKEHPATFGGFVIRGKKISDYDPLFFRYLLCTYNARKQTIRMGAGAQHYNIGQEGLERISLYFPSIIEQEKISLFLNLLDDKIEVQNKIIEDLKVLKKELCNKVFSKGSFVRLGVLIEEVTTRNKSNAYDNVLSVSNKMGFIKQSEQFEDRTVASENKSNYKVVTEGCFAYNPARINVGSIALLTTYKIGIISPMYVCFKTKKALDSEYLNFYYQSGYFYKELQKKLEGSVRQCLTYENMCAIHIPYVPIEEQKKIVSALRAITVLIGREDNYLNTLRKQKAYFLNAMFI